MDLIALQSQLDEADRWQPISMGDDDGLMYVNKDGRFYDGWLSFGPGPYPRMAGLPVVHDTTLEQLVKKLARVKRNYFNAWRKTWDEGHFCWCCEGTGKVSSPVGNKPMMCGSCSGLGILQHKPGEPGYIQELIEPRLRL